MKSRTHTRFVIGLIISFLALNFATTAVSAQDPDMTLYFPIITKAITLDERLTITPSTHTATVISPYIADLDDDNAILYYRKSGTSTWVQGPSMAQVSAALEWRGSIVSLEPSTTYELEIRYEDGGGNVLSVAGGIFATLPDYPEVGGSGTTYTVPTDGSLETVLDMSQPGDTIQLLSGTYHESITLNSEHSGTAGQYVTIEPADGATVIFDGSDQNINSAGNDWTFYQSHANGDIYYTDLAYGDTNNCSSTMQPGYVGQTFNGKQTRYMLFDSGTDDWTNDFLAAQGGKAFYVCDGSGPGPVQRLYVATYNGDDPDNQDMHIGELTRAFHFRNADYIRIRGIEFRHYTWFGLLFGFASDEESGPDYNIIENNTFHGIGRHHIRMSGQAGAGYITHNLIQNNQFSEDGYRDANWVWAVSYLKARSGVIGIRIDNTGSGNRLGGNTFTSGHDAIAITNESSDVDVYNNTITECMDDGISIDNNPGQNIRVWGNTINDCFVGISIQDWNNAQPGPAYIYRNLVTGGVDPQNRTDYLGGTDGYDTDTIFKAGSDQIPNGSVFVYHNTFHNIQGTNGHGLRDSGGTNFANMTTRNNIWNVDGRVIYLQSTNTLANNDFDCDNMHNIVDDNRFVTWGSGNIFTNLATFQGQTGHQTNGISNNATSFDANFNLQAGSPDIDAGCIVPGFSDGYIGSAPDMGAFEFTPQ